MKILFCPSAECRYDRTTPCTWSSEYWFFFLSAPFEFKASPLLRPNTRRVSRRPFHDVPSEMSLPGQHHSPPLQSAGFLVPLLLSAGRSFFFPGGHFPMLKVQFLWFPPRLPLSPTTELLFPVGSPPPPPPPMRLSFTLLICHPPPARTPPLLTAVFHAGGLNVIFFPPRSSLPSVPYLRLSRRRMLIFFRRSGPNSFTSGSRWVRADP